MADPMELDMSEILEGLDRMERDMEIALTGVVEYMAPRTESHSKRNAPWTDRTTNARNGLHAVHEVEKPKYRVVLAHGVPYGIYLETRFSGRYQIILPTIEAKGREAMDTVRGLMGRMGKGGAS